MQCSNLRFNKSVPSTELHGTFRYPSKVTLQVTRCSMFSEKQKTALDARYADIRFTENK